MVVFKDFRIGGQQGHRSRFWAHGLIAQRGPESVPLNPSGGEPDLHPFNSKNRLSSLRLRMIATSTSQNILFSVSYSPSQDPSWPSYRDSLLGSHPIDLKLTLVGFRVWAKVSKSLQKVVFLANPSFNNRCLDLAWRGRRWQRHRHELYPDHSNSGFRRSWVCTA